MRRYLLSCSNRSLGENRDLFALDKRITVVLHSCAGRNNPAHDHIFFQSAKLIELPLIAASVSTRVVSWNDAAETKLSVVRDALVMPRSKGLPCAGLPLSALTLIFSSWKSILSTCSPMR